MVLCDNADIAMQGGTGKRQHDESKKVCATPGNKEGENGHPRDPQKCFLVPADKSIELVHKKVDFGRKICSPPVGK